ncbi:MAG: right-handed parallel beta-helix repeat-containing protein [Acidimicrobiales bacterium]
MRAHARWLRRHWGRVVAGIGIGTAAVLSAPIVGATTLAAPAAAATTCEAAGSTGLTAAIVATSGDVISTTTVTASACDVGIYVGSTVTGVSIVHTTVTKAKFQGIFAEDSSHLVIRTSTVEDNGFTTLTTTPKAPTLGTGKLHSDVSDSFGISLFGVSDSSVVNNTIHDNGRGGIGIMDNGPNDPGAMTANQDKSAPLVASSHDSVVGNTISTNFAGCGLVVATQNFGGALSDLLLASNKITGALPPPGENGPVVGGLVVAADTPHSSVTDVIVAGNTVSDSFEGGIVVNAESFDSSTSQITIFHNTLSGNNWGSQEAPHTAGIIVYANPATTPPNTSAPINLGTVIFSNGITGQYNGIWSQGHNSPFAFANHITVTSGGAPVTHVTTATAGA